MKKFALLLIVVTLLCALVACGDSNRTTKMSNEKAENTVVSVENVGGTIDMDEDTAKELLGAYTPKELGISDSIDEYKLVVTAYNKNGISGGKVEAFAPDAKDDDKAEATFLISGIDCYKYNSKTKKFEPLFESAESTTKKNNKTTTEIPDDPEISFPYHKGNNAALQARFANYDLSATGLKKDISNYVFVITARAGTASDGSPINIVELYEKNGENTGVTFGVGASSDYRFDEASDSYVPLS